MAMHSTAQQVADEAMQELPSCSRPIVATVLRDVASDFLARSQVLTVDLDAMDIDAGTYLYTLTVPTAYPGYRIQAVVGVLVNGLALRANIDWRMFDRNTLQLRSNPTADITDGLVVTVALTIDDIYVVDLTPLLDWWGPIAVGVKGRAMMMPAKPWTDQRTGPMYLAEYNHGLSDAMAFAARRGTNEPMRLRM